MSEKKNKQKNQGHEDPSKEYEKEYPENGDNFSAGKEETGQLPNNPAENAERKAPEDEEKKNKQKNGGQKK